MLANVILIRSLRRHAWSLTFARAEHSAAGSFLSENQAKFLPFELTVDQAKQRFLEWHRSSWLSPNNLLTEGKYTVRPLLLPYWAFDVDATVKYAGTVGTTSEGKHSSSINWHRAEWAITQHRKFTASQPEMQVYASYQYRRDFGQLVKATAPLDALHLITKPQAQAGELRFPSLFIDPVHLELPEMRKSLAWEFALRAAREKEVQLCTDRLREDHKTPHVKDVEVVFSPSTRTAHLIYFPAYAIDYTYGETFNVHGERHAQHFRALVSALEGVKNVAGERHVSVQKAALVGGGATLGLMAATSTLASLIGGEPVIWTSLDYMFPSLTVGAAAGLMAQIVPSMHAKRAEQEWVEAENALQAAVASSKAGFVHSEKDPNEGLRSSMEWMRWEKADTHSWDAGKRQRWAERLYEAQISRKREWRRAKEESDRHRERREAEELREQRRHARWGSGSRSRQSHMFLGGRRAGGAVDYLGYYKALGLDPSIKPVTKEDIKKGFRKAALRWHPDKHIDEGGKKRARDEFQLIRTAYDTLKDPERKKSYDLGELRSSSSY